MMMCQITAIQSNAFSLISFEQFALFDDTLSDKHISVDPSGRPRGVRHHSMLLAGIPGSLIGCRLIQGCEWLCEPQFGTEAASLNDDSDFAVSMARCVGERRTFARCHASSAVSQGLNDTGQRCLNVI